MVRGSWPTAPRLLPVSCDVCCVMRNWSRWCWGAGPRFSTSAAAGGSLPQRNGTRSHCGTGTVRSPAAPCRCTAASCTTSIPGKTAAPPTSTTSSRSASATTSCANPLRPWSTRTATPHHPTNGPSDPGRVPALSSYHPSPSEPATRRCWSQSHHGSSTPSACSTTRSRNWPPRVLVRPGQNPSGPEPIRA